MSPLKTLALAAALTALATPTFAAFCETDVIDVPDIVIPGADITEQRDITETRDLTEQRDIIELQKQVTGYSAATGSGFQPGGRMLALCYKPDHPWYAKMTATGACKATGNLASLVTPVGGANVVTRPVKVGEETVVVGQEDVKIGEETVVVGKEDDTIVVTPDDPIYRVGLYIDPPGPRPEFWAGTPWLSGNCPGGL